MRLAVQRIGWKIRILLIGLLIFGGCLHLAGQSSTPDVPTPSQPRSFDQDALKDLTESPAYQYYDRKERRSLISRFLEKLAIWIFDNPEKSETILNLIIWCLVLLGVGVLAWYLYRYRPPWLFAAPARRVNTGAGGNTEEDIHEMDLASLQAQALGRGDYRLALRLAYLQILRSLSERDLIEWLPDKTNQAYLEEMRPQPEFDAFNKLTRLFEYAWYGGFELKEKDYHRAAALFLKFRRIVHPN